GAAVPTITGGAGSLFAEHADAGALTLTGDGDPETLVCDNETNARLLFGTPGRSAFPKDGINDNVVSHAETVNPDGVGTKGSLHYTITVPAGEERVVKVRLAAGKRLPTIDTSYDEILERRKAEADAFFADLTPAGTTADEALVLRQSIAGLLWGKQYFHYNVERWLHGDPAGPVPPASRLTGRNAGWEHFNARDVISMPDPWEYPWFAAWDLAFHCVPLAHVDPQFAKRQLILMLREWYMHPSGKLAAYEWKFDDVNPPVHAWAALRVFLIDGGQDFEFLSRIFTKLLLNFTWWVNRKDSEGNNVFEGGFLGLDNITVFDRSETLPGGASLEQSDATGWMGMFSLVMMRMALELAKENAAYEGLATKFFEHYVYIGAAMKMMRGNRTLWDDADGFFYDLLRYPDGTNVPFRVRSLVGLIPLYAVERLERKWLEPFAVFRENFDWFMKHRADIVDYSVTTVHHGGETTHILAVVDQNQLQHLLARVADPAEFLSTYGLRSLSKAHQANPFSFGNASVTYEPAEASTKLKGGNSNWRGPIWFPTTFLMIETLRKLEKAYSGNVRVALRNGQAVPADVTPRHDPDAILAGTRADEAIGAGAAQTRRRGMTLTGVPVPPPENTTTLTGLAADLAKRMTSIFLPDAEGYRTSNGPRGSRQAELFAHDPHWKDLIWFFEYFNGDTGEGLGASHQTGWTALVASLIDEWSV
ncbi:MAG: hypothetical protein QOC81_949, partial [Thermoanaerobaculia bacterium]|nr:hypothetical protein [Thermoanaerobaculia bacterium]